MARPMVPLADHLYIVGGMPEWPPLRAQDGVWQRTWSSTLASRVLTHHADREVLCEKARDWFWRGEAECVAAGRRFQFRLVDMRNTMSPGAC